jgi:hypothetical protein
VVTGREGPIAAGDDRQADSDEKVSLGLHDRKARARDLNLYIEHWIAGSDLA